MGCAGSALARTPAHSVRHHRVRQHRTHSRRYTHSRRSVAIARSGPGSNAGRILGNRKSLVYYHTGSDRNLPTGQDWVYFRSETAAQAAGYHRGQWRPGQVLDEIKSPNDKYAVPHPPLRREQPPTAPTQPAPGP